MPGATANEKLRNFLKKQEGTQGLSIFDPLDDLFESLTAAGLTRGSKPMAEDLRAVQFQKIRGHVAGAKAVAELPADHPARAGLRDIRRRLARGEESAIGGANYATQHFPRLLLDRIVEGAVKVVVFDGTPAAGRAFVVDRFDPGPREPGVQPQYMTTEVQGLDGSGGRTLVTFRTEGAQVLLRHGAGHFTPASQRRLHPALRTQQAADSRTITWSSPQRGWRTSMRSESTFNGR